MQTHLCVTCCKGATLMLRQCTQTPDAPRSRNSQTWVADLEAYLAAHCATPPQAGDVRHQLVSSLKSQPTAAEAWHAFLSHEEARHGNITGSHTDHGGVSLYHLYFWAVHLVPRSKNQNKDEYIQLWLGYARQQWYVEVCRKSCLYTEPPSTALWPCHVAFMHACAYAAALCSMVQPDSSCPSFGSESQVSMAVLHSLGRAIRMMQGTRSRH